QNGETNMLTFKNKKRSKPMQRLPERQLEDTSMLAPKKPAASRKQSTPKQPMSERQIEVVDSHEDKIRQLAYHKWQEAGCPSSDGMEFWLAAEEEDLRGRGP